jgi:alkylation response protein AidB-like acyl-CoA dehydrogenase
VVIEEAATQGCPWLIAVISPGICGTIVDKHGGDQLKRLWPLGIADGSVKMAFTITEPDAGSNIHVITTTAHADGGGWRISGTKHWTSGIDGAGSVLVVARMAEARSDGRHPLPLFVVPTDTGGCPGSASRPPAGPGAPVHNVLRRRPGRLRGAHRRNGLHQVFAGLNPEQITVACVSKGIATCALDKATRYARERQVWSGGRHRHPARPADDLPGGRPVRPGRRRQPAGSRPRHAGARRQRPGRRVRAPPAAR